MSSTSRKTALPGSSSLVDQVAHRRWECGRLLDVLAEQGLAPTGDGAAEVVPDGLAEAVHAYVARAPCRLLAVQIEDLLGVVEQVNYEKNKLQVAVQILGRSTPVELDFGQVEKS